MAEHTSKLSYLNAILTVNAVLLAGVLWTNIAGDPLGSVALAAPQVPASPPNDGGVPNAGLQRLDMLNELRAIRAQLERFESTVTGGRLRVNVANFNDMKLDFDYAKLRDAIKGVVPPPTGTVAPATGAAPPMPESATSSVKPATGAAPTAQETPNSSITPATGTTQPRP